jgi:hypothetical protein
MKSGDKQAREKKSSLPERFFRTVAFVGLGLSFVTALCFFAAGRFLWCGGVAVGAAWSLLNGYFLFRLVSLGLTPGKNMGRSIVLFSMLKFPVLYLAGYLILKSRFFPVVSLLVGLTIFLFAFALAWFRLNAGNVFSNKGAA